LSWLKQVATTSIGRKFLMALTGLGLVLFVVVHLAGNLLLFAGPEAYNDYAHKLHANEGLLMVAETGLFAIIVVHLWNAFITARANRAARSRDYAMKVSKIDASPLAAPASNVMVASGLIILLFLIVHLSDFKLELRNPGPEGELPFDKAVRLLHDPLTWIVYVVGSAVLGYHLSHGFQSAFQTLGLRHPKYSPAIRTASHILAVVIGVGFASFPVWATGVAAKPAPTAVAPAANPHP
jgi:succinate dehydrogenase / fumarate reductase cytochrome b subunit